MSAPTVTEREAVIRERAAFEAGSIYRHLRQQTTNGNSVTFAAGETDRETARRYPLPKVERPVVMEVLGESYEMRVVNGIPQFRHISPGVAWADIDTFGAPRLTVNGARVLVALLATPTETVEVEA